ncbi:MAG: hypothetical protein HY525_14000 [Betaproteobacteria bacterium]|nr:hypothetical protein [Betaproteobacteria bacterium]
MTGTIIFLALVFGGIAMWAGISMMKRGNKPAPRPRVRTVAQAQTQTDPWGAAQMRRRERNSHRPGQRAS